MDPRVLSAAEELTLKGLARITLLGQPQPIIAEARRLNMDISHVRALAPLPGCRATASSHCCA
jgi:phosphotransacetylase